MDHDISADLSAGPAPRTRIELTDADLVACLAKARAGQTVTLHFTNWPGTPSKPVTVLYGDQEGNIMSAGGDKLCAMAYELSVVPRDGLEVRDLPASPRLFTMDRMAQGFRDQAHLDAFWRYHDHVQAGREAGPAGCGCGLPGPAAETTDGGWQPSETICPAGQALSAAAS